MAAGLGFKDFITGEVLTAADVDGYLMQGIWVFASAAARDSAVTSPQEGNFAYLKDTNTTTYYTGSAWTNLDTTGMVNPMTTTGDTIYSSSGSTPARLGIGSTGQVLTVSGGLPVWSTPAGGGGKVLQVVSNTYSTSTSITSTSYVDTGLSCSITPTSATSKVLIMVSNSTAAVRDSTNLPLSWMNIVRGSTQINEQVIAGETLSGPTSTDTASVKLVTATWLDSPSTTSATTYKIQGKSDLTANNNTIRFQYNSEEAIMILMEIGA